MKTLVTREANAWDEVVGEILKCYQSKLAGWVKLPLRIKYNSFQEFTI